MADDSKLIVTPERPSVVDATLRRAQIGGVNVDYQADPRLAIQIPPAAVADGRQMHGLLTAMVNVQNALVREVIGLRETVTAQGRELEAERTTTRIEPDAEPEVDADAEEQAG